MTHPRENREGVGTLRRHCSRTMMQEPKRRRPRSQVMKELASQVRTAYIEERRLWEAHKHPETGEDSRPYVPGPYWDGGKNRLTGKARPPYWPRVVKFLVENGIQDFRGYIAAQFAARNVMGPVATPKNLVGEKALRIWSKWKKGKKERAASISSRFNCQKQILRCALVAQHEDLPDLSPEQIRQDVLLDTDLELSPLFRYCLAVSEGEARIAKLYETAAMAEFLSNDEAYCRVWREWIPEHFKDRAGRMACLVKEGYCG